MPSEKASNRQDKSTNSRTISRFSKYKSMIEESKGYDDSIRIDHIFSHLSYVPIQIQSYLKDTPCTLLDRMSTIQSELDTSIESSAGDALLPSLASIDWLSESNEQFKSQKNSQIPAYLQQFNRGNSITPNFQHPLFNIKQAMANLTNLIKCALKAIHHVLGCALRVASKDRQIKVFSNHPDCLTLKYFMFSGWENINPDPSIDLIKPKKNFQITLTLPQILDELDLLLCKASRYELAGTLTQEIDQGLYTSIRENLLEIESSLVNCSNSLYSLWNSEEYPRFYYLYLRILRKQQAVKQEERDYTVREFRRLWQLHEPVTCSEIGRAVWSMLHASNF